ncbi:unnamed protein product [Effrenium voratum]|uniref:Hexosyltransferase n=1 Tax=Effrenium voratum TaxID=2562239 RepID=A0AA36JDF4_9DINO|nr:unnamed protein product [Effrenium voratum]CAJ1455737.1 unnamed protein product [Effrenium voratum]
MASCDLLKLACADIFHFLARPCRRGKSRKLPARGLRVLLLKCVLILAAVAGIGVTLHFSQAFRPRSPDPIRLPEVGNGSWTAVGEVEGVEEEQPADATTRPEPATRRPEPTTQPEPPTRPEPTTRRPETSPSPAKSPSKGSRSSEPAPAMAFTDSVHVCFCSDDTDWRPVAAAINSTLQNAKRPEKLIFHLITSPELAEVVGQVLKEVLPVLRRQLQVHSSVSLQKRIKGQISYRKSSGARKGLASAFNFAPFYLEEFLAQSDHALPKRLVYLDTDVLLLGDVERLATAQLHGLPAAAVEDCSQHFDIYIDFGEMAGLGTGVDPKECVFNRGIFVMDVLEWKKRQITRDIERWMAKYRESKKDIYKFGMSQPPWLLALHGKYHQLGAEWNCRGLGREALSLQELKALKAELKLSFKELQKVGARAMGDQAQPYIASCSDDAEVLHFNGKLKPWRSNRWVRRQPSPMCMVKAEAFPSLPRKSVAGKTFVRCADIWSNFLSPEAAQLLNATAVNFYKVNA